MPTASKIDASTIASMPSHRIIHLGTMENSEFEKCAVLNRHLNFGMDNIPEVFLQELLA
jgi:hypothetical protein